MCIANIKALSQLVAIAGQEPLSEARIRMISKTHHLLETVLDSRTGSWFFFLSGISACVQLKHEMRKLLPLQ